MQLNQIPRYKSVTLLQGPVGPFFKKFSKYLKKRNTKVFKINFKRKIIYRVKKDFRKSKFF